MGSLRKPDETRKIIHAYMVSFPGQGHVNPLLRLGKRLADFGLFVTLCTPEFAGVNIRQANNISGDADPTQFGPGMIQFEFFDDGWDFNNPNRHDLTSYMAQLEVVGRQKIPEMIKKQSEMGRPVSCLINNPFIPWVSDMAEDLGIPSALLWIQSCASFAAYYYYYNKLVPFPTEEEPEIEVEIPHMPLLKYDEIPSFLHPSSPYPFLAGAILGQFKNLKKPFCILMETFQELENEIVQHMSEICCPIKTVGPLCSELKRNRVTEDESVIFNSKSSSIRSDFFTAEKSCVEWLDLKPPRSVVYISFGSVVHLKQEQIDELALGLVASEVSFLWVLRPPPREFTEKPHVLPEGFLDKVGDKGKIVQWSPQEEVLAHPSTACFLTHCGWNSTMEVLASGVPVVAFPQWGDQVTDAMFLVDVFKVGFRLCRGEAEDKIVSRDEVERCLRAATSDLEAAEIRENALKWKKAAEEAVSEGGSTSRNMQDFVEQVTRIGCNLW